MRVTAQLLFVLLSFLLPFFHLSRWKRLSVEEALVTSFAAGSLLYGFVAFFTHALGLPQRTVHCLSLIALGASVAPFLRRGLDSLRGMRFSCFGFFIAFLLLVMALEASFPVYIGGFWYFDWWQHYNLSQMYMGKVPHEYLWLGMYNFASRTPLMNLNAAFFLSILGDNYWTYQIVAAILNCTFILPAFLLCRHISGKRAATMICALLFVSPSIVHNTWYPWPKLFAAYFVLLAAYFYLKQRGQVYTFDTKKIGDIPPLAPVAGHRIPDFLATSCEGNPTTHVQCVDLTPLVFALVWSGFFAHQSSLFSSGVILIDLFVRALRREPRRALLLGVACALCFVLINGVWFAWATSFFGMKRSFLSYYERPATFGGLSGYLILFTYHTLATFCSPLFVHDFAGRQFNALRFFENVEVLYYNSFAGIATVAVFVTALVVLFKRLRLSAQSATAYAVFAASPTVRRVLLIVAAWALAMGALIFIVPDFGAALFSHYFNHPDFARKMFLSLFLAGGFSIGAVGVVLWQLGRGRDVAGPRSEADFAATLLFWMAAAGYAGGIATHHELYIHGMISAGCATSALLTVMFLARVCSDASRTMRILLAIPVLGESFLVTWLPLVIIKYNWGWVGEKNWALKEQNSLVLMADLLPGAWKALALSGIAIQIIALVTWALSTGEEQVGGVD